MNILLLYHVYGMRGFVECVGRIVLRLADVSVFFGFRSGFLRDFLVEIDKIFRWNIRWI